MSSPCNTPDCGCVDCVETPIAPPCTTCDCNPGFCDDGCEEYASTKCFVYSGDVLPCLHIAPGDSLNTVLAKVDESYCRVSGEGGTDKWVKTSATDQVSNYLINKIDTDNSSVRIENTNIGADEKLTFNYDQVYKVSTDGSDTEDYLINKIILKPDPLGIVTALPLTNVNGKVAIGFTLNMEALCSLLHNSACIPAVETCNVQMGSIELTPFENGDLLVNITYSAPVGAIDYFEYTIDAAETRFSASSRFTIHNLSAGTHGIGVRAICNNRQASARVAQTFLIPTINITCPSVSATTTDNSVAIAWSTLPNYIYTAFISYSEFGTPFQSAQEVNGTHVFTNLSSSTEYWVKVVPTYLGVTKDLCSAQRAATISQTCSASVSNLVVSGITAGGAATLSWSGNSAQSYEYKIGSANWIPTTGTSVALTDQSIGTHTFFVRSKCANGLYGSGTQTDFTIPAAACNSSVDTIAVSNLSDSGTATITWTASGALSYEYKLGTSGAWVPTTLTTLNLSGQSAGLHTIFVRPLCSNQLYGAGNSANFTIPTAVCTALINNLSMDSATSNGNVTISWSAAQGGVTYEYQVGNGAWTPTTATSISLTGLSTGTQVSVRGKCANGLYGNAAAIAVTIPAIVCAAPGTPVLSDTVTLTYTAEWTSTDSDPLAAINAGTDNLTYPHSSAIALGSDLVCNYGAEANNKYLVQRIQLVEGAKTAWFNTSFNNGTFPDSVYYASFVHGNFRYYVTRDTFTFDSTSFSVTLKS